MGLHEGNITLLHIAWLLSFSPEPQMSLCSCILQLWASTMSQYVNTTAGMCFLTPCLDLEIVSYKTSLLQRKLFVISRYSYFGAFIRSRLAQRTFFLSLQCKGKGSGFLTTPATISTPILPSPLKSTHAVFFTQLYIIPPSALTFALNPYYIFEEWQPGMTQKQSKHYAVLKLTRTISFTHYFCFCLIDNFRIHNTISLFVRL